MRAWGGAVATPGLHSASSAVWAPGGEAALLIRCGTRFSEIVLNTGLHAAAATISLAKALTVCSLYLPPNTPISKLSLAELFEQLSKPFLVVGDFNAHSPACGDSRRHGRDRMLEEFMAENDLIILNSGEQSFVHSAYHSTSAIDLAVASPSIAAECSWAAHSDLCGSDHFPIFLTLTLNFNDNVHTPTFNLKKKKPTGAVSETYADCLWTTPWPSSSSLLQSFSMLPGRPYPFINGRNSKPECPGLRRNIGRLFGKEKGPKKVF
ncbi:RNA-directed DNA polymerase from mobile element jockey [Plakobranchus ocellatus]|uniref:RNA-directed DNA polymerase from mobile element jockey n=1 Tax=Plakobranchus ocellatus TaxID=259542 RepID=A0AAV4DJG6_9GAST|nr:RNA-directed DNA polymerase from mobile element jockey [Plakobranchus ocellatus]